MSEPSSTAPDAEPGSGGSPPSEGCVWLPAGAFSRLSGRCGELGAGSVAALREAGRRAGRALVDGPSDDPAGGGIAASQPLGRFWDQLRGAAGDRGFGLARYEVLADDVAGVDLRGSPEASVARGEGLPRPGCHFAAGWLGGALTAAAGEPVAVLEVRCAAETRSADCRFLVGPEGRLQRIRLALRGGLSVEEAVESD